jgi:anti-sigma-K factor RskA
VTWDEARQQGEFTVRGLPPNDPTKEQYQLWIMDANQKQPIPVDGGVFDVKPDGTATLAVRSPIRVSDAQAFAISKEKPGGVPAPTMTQVVLVMKPKSG